MNKDMKKNIFEVAAFVVLLYCGLQHLDIVWSVLKGAFSLFVPFILGGSIAFIVNVPMKWIEEHLFSNNSKLKSMKRPLSYFLTLLLVLGVLALALGVIIPELVNTAKTIAASAPQALQRMQQWFIKNSSQWPEVADWMQASQFDLAGITSKLTEVLQKVASGLLSSGFQLIGNVINGIVSFFVGIVFSVYILFRKEKLAVQIKKIMYAMLPKKRADSMLRIADLANRTFSNFLSGQCLEACILGAMFVIVMSILGMPYAMMIGVVIALTALIPIVGAFIGCAVGVILILLVNPMQAFWFLILFLVLQQIEGNLIYPHVVGNSVGLPSMWVLVAVTVGGSLFGILGILIFIPLCSVCYTLFRKYIHDRLRKKKIQLFEE